MVDQAETLPSPLGIAVPTQDFANLPSETMTRFATSNQPPQSSKPIYSTHTVNKTQSYDYFTDIGLSNNGFGMDWGQSQLPGDIQDLFSGFFT